ncbi:MAG: hypothetical protein EWM45_14160 [Rhodopseudomonas palustris]|nr:MAG: hypothetical protein EWM45_14160 [Rhodopseudomonas palustris]
MRDTPLLTAPPTKVVTTLPELYALAIAQAERSTSRYRDLAMSLTNAADRAMAQVRNAVELLCEHERTRGDRIRLRCQYSADKSLLARSWPDAATNLVPSKELSDIADSALSTPSQVWQLAVRHRQREFVFWTYVAAHAIETSVQSESEGFAREALFDASILRHERRRAWRAERESINTESGSQSSGTLLSAALIESLLFKEVVRWSMMLADAERNQLFAAAGYAIPEADDVELLRMPDTNAPEHAPQRAIRYAEQLAAIYLDEAERANDQASLDLAQNLAATAIKRMAKLRAWRASNTV